MSEDGGDEGEGRDAGGQGWARESEGEDAGKREDKGEDMRE